MSVKPSCGVVRLPIGGLFRFRNVVRHPTVLSSLCCEARVGGLRNHSCGAEHEHRRPHPDDCHVPRRITCGDLCCRRPHRSTAQILLDLARAGRLARMRSFDWQVVHGRALAGRIEEGLFDVYA